MNRDVELENMVKELVDKGIISNSDIWIKEEYSKHSIKSLLIKLAYML